MVTLQAKAPDEVEAYKAFVLELAEGVGKAAGGGDAAEAATVEKIRGALGYRLARKQSTVWSSTRPAASGSSAGTHAHRVTARPSVRGPAASSSCS